MKNRTTKLLVLSVAASLLPLHSSAQPTLTGLTIYSAAADGSGPNVHAYWDTRGGAFAWNVYLFTGSVAAPTFLTTGDTDFSLNPALPLSLGAHVIQFAGDGSIGGHLGLNLYFDNSPTNGITAFVPIDGSSNFQVVGRGLAT